MDAVRPYIAAVSGVKNSGKTTFLEKLIPELKKRGYCTAVLKHDGHEFQADTEGTDTFRLRQAGAFGTCIFSGSRWMAVKEQPDSSPEELAKLFPEADVILAEGLKGSGYPKFEIVRGEISKESVCDPATLLALVTDTGIKIAGIPSVGLEDIGKCANILQKRIEKYKKQKKI